MIEEQPYFRKYQLGNLYDDKEVSVIFPCDEENIQRICEKLGVENLATSKVQVLSVEDEKMFPLMYGQKTTLDELNYFEKRLQSFSSEEMKLFQAVGKALEAENMEDYIKAYFRSAERKLAVLNRKISV